MMRAGPANAWTAGFSRPVDERRAVASLGAGSDRSSRRGQALAEFGVSAVVALLLILGVVEFSRIMLVYTTLADAARMGARYAITHGTIPGNSASVGSIEDGVQAVVQKFLAPGTVNIKAAVITTSFPNSATTPGNPVQVTVSYPYDWLIEHFPITVTLSTTSEGIFTW